MPEYKTCAADGCDVVFAGRGRYHNRACRNASTRGRNRPRRQREQELGRKREAAVAARLGGALQPGSGSDPLRPGDFKLPGADGGFLVESKSTGHRRFTITLDVWSKIKSEAVLLGRRPMLALNIDGVRLAVVEESEVRC